MLWLQVSFSRTPLRHALTDRSLDNSGIQKITHDCTAGGGRPWAITIGPAWVDEADIKAYAKLHMAIYYRNKDTAHHSMPD